MMKYPNSCNLYNPCSCVSGILSIVERELSLLSRAPSREWDFQKVKPSEHLRYWKVVDYCDHGLLVEWFCVTAAKS